MGACEYPHCDSRPPRPARSPILTTRDRSYRPVPPSLNYRRLNHWGTPGAGHAPDGSPAHRAPLPRRFGEPDAIAAQRLTPGSTRSQSERRHSGPCQNVDHSHGQRQVTPSQPDAVARLKPVKLSVPGRLDGWVMHLNVAVVTHMEAAVPHPPGQLDALMGVPKWLRPAARKLEGIPTNGNRALPDIHRRTTTTWVANAYPWSPATRRLPPLRIDNPGLDHPELGVCGELRRHPGQNVIRRQAGIVVEEEQQLSLDQRHSSITTGRNPQIGCQPFGFHPIRQIHRPPPVANNDDIQVNLTLAHEAGQAVIQIVRPVTHRQDDDPEFRPPPIRPHSHRHRSLEDASTAIR